MVCRACSSGRPMKAAIRGVLILLTFTLTSCASRSMLLVARHADSKAPISVQSVVLMNSAQLRPEDRELNRILREELQRSAIRIESSTNANHVLGCWIDESWDEVITPERAPRVAEHVSVYPADGRVVYEYSYQPDFRPKSKLYVPSKGIKMALYSKHGSGGARVTPLWDGYIEIHSVKPEHMTKALQELMARMGKNFYGRVPLEK